MPPREYAPLGVDAEGLSHRLDLGWPFWMPMVGEGHFSDYIEQVLNARDKIIRADNREINTLYLQLPEPEPPSLEETVRDIAEYLQTEFDCGGTSWENMAKEILRMIPESCPYDCSHCRED